MHINSWDAIREAYIKNEEILIALPLFVECVPGLLLEFLETLPQKDKRTRLSFILQSGFAEDCQLRCGEEFLQKLPEYLSVRYGGCLVKGGDDFSIRFQTVSLHKSNRQIILKVGGDGRVISVFETVNVIMRSRMRESRTYGSVRGLYCEV